MFLVFPEFLLVSAPRPYEDGGIFAPKMDVLSAKIFGDRFSWGITVDKTQRRLLVKIW